MKKFSLGMAVLLTLVLTPAAFADYVIKLKNGRTVETAKCWEEKGEVKFEWEGGVASLPKKNVVSITWVEEKFSDRAPRPSQPAAEPKDVPAEPPKPTIQKVEDAASAEASQEVSVEKYKKEKAYYTKQFEDAYQRYLDATSRRDAEAKKKAWEEFNQYGGQVVKMETELRKKNNGQIPAWWKEGEKQ
jgi:hypothetical protein